MRATHLFQMKRSFGQPIDMQRGNGEAPDMREKSTVENVTALLLAIRESSLPDTAPSRVLTASYAKLLAEAKREKPNVPMDVWPPASGEASLAVGRQTPQPQSMAVASYDDLEFRVLRLLAALRDS